MVLTGHEELQAASDNLSVSGSGISLEGCSEAHLLCLHINAPITTTTTTTNKPKNKTSN